MKLIHFLARTSRLACQLTAALLVCALAGIAQAQISVGPSGVGPLTFDATPPAAEFSTFVITGGAATFADAATLDTAVATQSVAGINLISRQLPTSSTVPPSTFSGGFRHNNNATTGLFLMSRPTTDGTNAASAMLATFVNNSGAARSSLILSYDFNVYNALAGELPGYNVYYSLTGAEGSWTAIPELTGSETVGSKLGTLTLGSWPIGASLYVLWVDDNANGITDPGYSIDNLSVNFAVPPPQITQQPVGGTVTQGRSFTFTVVAAGPGLIYSWQKVGVGEVGTGSSFTITNAQPGDAGQYFVAVSNPGGSVSSDTVTLNVAADTSAPVMLAARAGANNATIVVTMDEPMCDDIACVSPFGARVSDSAFSWDIVNPNNPLEVIGVNAVALENGTNLVFTPGAALTAGQIYRVIHTGSAGQVGDLYQNLLPVNASIDTFPSLSFQQAVNGYAGTQDAEIHSNATADTPLGSAAVVGVDNDDAGIARGLLRFDGIFGTNPGQIPPGAEIVSATVTLNQVDAGSPANLHRMLIDWNQTTATWNLFNEGVTNDGIEAVVASDVLATSGNPIVINVTTSVQAWSDGQPNFGWVMISTGTDGWDWSSSESSTPPLLTVVYRVVPCTEAPAITTQPPATLNVNEGAPFSITVGVDACQPTFQWTKDGVDIPGANGSTLSVASAVAGAGGSGGSYRLRVTNPNGTVTSSAAVVTVVPDTTRPVLTRAIGPNNTSVVLTFNKPLSAGPAQNPASYSISGGVTVTAVALSNGANNATVILTTSARSASGQTLTISGLTDTRAAANVINPNPTVVNLTGSSVVAGSEWASAWLYNTNNLDGTPSWKDPSFVPGPDWLTGNALFGTEPSAGVIALFPAPLSTVIPPNDVAPGDFVTAYFRQTVTLPALSGGAIYVLEHFIDDGAVFYWDGVEFGRFNMTNGPVVYSTKAATANEASVQALRLPASAAAGGTHTLAVEVHQGGATTSSDILFGAQIRAVSTPPSLSISKVPTGVRVNWTADSNWRLLGANQVAGPYAPVAGNPFHSLTVPTGSQTNHNFYLLEFAPAP